MILRQFNPSGITAFRSVLAEARVRPAERLPLELLEDRSLTDPVVPKLKVDARRFTSRREAADYLTSVLVSLPQEEVKRNAGLWSWLSFFYFDEVCPVRSGKRKVRNDYAYIFEPTNSRHVYRHLLYIGWHAKRIAAPHDRLFLDNLVSSLDHVTSEVMKRLYLTRVPCIFEVLDRLYWDDRESGSLTVSQPVPATLRIDFPFGFVRWR